MTNRIGSIHIRYLLPYLGGGGRGGGASALLKRGRQHRVAEVYIGHLLMGPDELGLVSMRVPC